MKAILKHWKNIVGGYEIGEEHKPLFDGKTVRELSDIDLGEGDRMLILKRSKDLLLYGDEYIEVSDFYDIEEMFKL